MLLGGSLGKFGLIGFELVIWYGGDKEGVGLVESCMEYINYTNYHLT